VLSTICAYVIVCSVIVHMTIFKGVFISAPHYSLPQICFRVELISDVLLYNDVMFPGGYKELLF
jgi:hypothetical protein